MSRDGEITRSQSDWVLAALAGLGTAVVVTDPRGRVVSMNPVAETLTGWTQEEAVGRTISTMFRLQNEDTRRPVADPVAAVLASGTAAVPGGPAVLVARDGTNWFLEAAAAPLRDGTGASVGAVLVLRDVGERRRAYDALAISETRYRRLFETAQDGILIVDADTRRVFDVNPFLTDLLGYTQDDLIGKELWEIGLFQDIETSKAAFRTLQEKGYIRYEDLPLRTKDGRQIEVEFVSNVYAVGDSRVIQCNIRDVTDRKRAEAGLRVAHEHLESRVTERTAELAHSNGSLTAEITRREQAEASRHDLQLRLATAQEDERRRIARELHDQMGQHLTALSLGLKLLWDASPDPSPARERLPYLQEITAQIGREVHNLALELRPTSLDDLGLATALRTYGEGWAGRTGIEIDFHATGPDTTRVPPAVETALYRVVLEALANVHRHAAARRVSVILQRSEGLVSAVVEDDGQGFDADTVPGTAGSEGRLGLLGMRERLGLVGGMLTIESAPGRGTTVIARVPTTEGEHG